MPRSPAARSPTVVPAGVHRPHGTPRSFRSSTIRRRSATSSCSRCSSPTTTRPSSIARDRTSAPSTAPWFLPRRDPGTGAACSQGSLAGFRTPSSAGGDRDRAFRISSGRKNTTSTTWKSAGSPAAPCPDPHRPPAGRGVRRGGVAGLCSAAFSQIPRFSSAPGGMLGAATGSTSWRPPWRCSARSWASWRRRGHYRARGSPVRDPSSGTTGPTTSIARLTLPGRQGGHFFRLTSPADPAQAVAKRGFPAAHPCPRGFSQPKDSRRMMR